MLLDVSRGNKTGQLQNSIVQNKATENKLNASKNEKISSCLFEKFVET